MVLFLRFSCHGDAPRGSRVSQSFLSAIGEYTRDPLALSHIPEYELFSFGDDYNRKLCELIQAHLEIDVDDSLCYVGDVKGQWVDLTKNQLNKYNHTKEINIWALISKFLA